MLLNMIPSGRGNLLTLIASCPLQEGEIMGFGRDFYKLPTLARGTPWEWPMIGAFIYLVYWIPQTVKEKMRTYAWAPFGAWLPFASISSVHPNFIFSEKGKTRWTKHNQLLQKMAGSLAPPWCGTQSSNGCLVLVLKCVLPLSSTVGFCGR